VLSCSLAAGHDSAIGPVGAYGPDAVEDCWGAAEGGSFSFLVHPAGAGFATEHALFGGPVFGWGVRQVVEFAGLGGGDGAVA
jgi:hypothetical protein